VDGREIGAQSDAVLRTAMPGHNGWVSSVDLDKTHKLGLYSLHPIPMRGAARDRHGSRGGMRWTRQRRAGTRVAGRKPGERARALTKGAFKGRRRVRDFSSGERPRCAMRTGAEMCPIGIACARRPKSCGPSKSGLLFRVANRPMKVPRRRRRQVSTVAGESTKQADKTTACGTPDDVRCDRGD
jgi:hypothetical protein